MYKPTVLLIILVCGTSACSSIRSTSAPKGDKVDGLTYYMPKKDILVTMAAKGGSVGAITIHATAAYPDLDQQYALTHGGNVFGKNTLDIGVNENGLLASTKATTVSGVTDAFKSLAASQARSGELDVNAAASCPDERTYSFVFKAKTETYQRCGLAVAVTELGDASGGESHSKDDNKSYSGVFYRQSRPYLVEVRDNGSVLMSQIVFSPSEAPSNFMPVSKTFFANNEAEFTFVDGVPTKYKQETDGEFVALLKLPADVIEAYFAALGATFDAFSTADEKESKALEQSIALELSERKYTACKAAIMADNEELIKELEC